MTLGKRISAISSKGNNVPALRPQIKDVVQKGGAETDELIASVFGLIFEWKGDEEDKKVLVDWAKSAFRMELADMKAVWLGRTTDG